VPLAVAILKANSLVWGMKKKLSALSSQLSAIS
jgi:hypothetical protein